MQKIDSLAKRKRSILRKPPNEWGLGGRIMKKLIILCGILLCSCSNYIIDPRASKHPKEIIRDGIECDKLIKDNLNVVDRFIVGDKFKKKCLINRGHSIIN